MKLLVQLSTPCLSRLIFLYQYYRHLGPSAAMPAATFPVGGPSASFPGLQCGSGSVSGQGSGSGAQQSQGCASSGGSGLAGMQGLQGIQSGLLFLPGACAQTHTGIRTVAACKNSMEGADSQDMP